MAKENTWIKFAGAFGRGDAGPQRMAGIGRAHPALFLAAVERQRIGADFLAPEGFIEMLFQTRGCFFLGGGETVVFAEQQLQEKVGDLPQCLRGRSGR